MSSAADVEMLLDRLLTATEALRESAHSHAAGHAAELLAQRQQLISSLHTGMPAAAFTEQQRAKLERAVRLGDEARQTFLIQRETSRRELQEKIAGRRLNESFKPYQPKKLGGLNIKL